MFVYFPPDIIQFSRFLTKPNFDDWNACKLWLRDIIEATNGSKAQILHVAVVFVRRFNNDVAGLSHKFYYPKGENYIEEVRECFIPIKKLPELLRAKLDSDKEIEITEEIERELNLTL